MKPTYPEVTFTEEYKMGFSDGQQDIIDALKLFDWDTELSQKKGEKDGS